jgi:hypothetical protein
LATKADNNAYELYVNDCNGVRQLLERLDPHKAKATLGIWQEPSGVATDQVKVMRKLIEEWADHPRTGKLKRHEAWLALTTTI